jgi:hypothetical protein
LERNQWEGTQCQCDDAHVDDGKGGCKLSCDYPKTWDDEKKECLNPSCPSGYQWSSQKGKCICNEDLHEYQGKCGYCSLSFLDKIYAETSLINGLKTYTDWSDSKQCCILSYASYCQSLTQEEYYFYFTENTNTPEDCGSETCLSFFHKGKTSDKPTECIVEYSDSSSPTNYYYSYMIDKNKTNVGQVEDVPCTTLKKYSIDGGAHTYIGNSDDTLKEYCPPRSDSGQDYIQYFLGTAQEYNEYATGCTNRTTLPAKKVTCVYSPVENESGGGVMQYYLCGCAPKDEYNGLCAPELFREYR